MVALNCHGASTNGFNGIEDEAEPKTEVMYDMSCDLRATGARAIKQTAVAATDVEHPSNTCVLVHVCD